MRAILIILLYSYCLNSTAQVYQSLYDEAYNTLIAMAEDETKYSFKKAIYLVENAYSNGTLDTLYLNTKINSLKNLATAFISQATFEYEAKDKDVITKYASIFKVMTDSIVLQNQYGKTTYHKPFTYDFNDFFGKQQWEQMFVSKLIATKKGNCHSLPYLYKILCEELDVTAHLALAPNHIYIKHRSLNNGWYNTELTSGIFPIDAWLMASGYIHLDAITNGVYMKALNDKESIALCLVDLVQGYQQKEMYSLDFVIQCTNKALAYYPNYTHAMILKTDALGKKIENMLKERGKTFSDVLQFDDTRAMFNDIQTQLTKIHELGYRQMPEDMYLDWLVSLKTEKSKYENKKISTFNNRN